MDGNLLNTFIRAFSVLSDYKSNNEEKRASFEIIDNLKSNEQLCFEVGLVLISNQDYNNNYNQPNIQFLNLAGSQLIEHSIKYHSNYFNNNVEKIKATVLSILSKSNSMFTAALRLNIAKIICEVTKRTWPALWQTFLNDVGSLASYGEVQLEIVLHVLLRLSEDLNGMDESLHAVRKREMIERLTMAQADIFSLFRQHILSVFQFGNCMTSNEHILKVILKTLSGFIGWSSLDQIFGINNSNSTTSLPSSLQPVQTQTQAQTLQFANFPNFDSNNIVHILLILLNHVDLDVLYLSIECLQKLAERKLKSHLDSFLILISNYSFDIFECIFSKYKNDDIRQSIVHYFSTLESNQIVPRIEMGKVSFDKVPFHRFISIIIVFVTDSNYDICFESLNIIGNVFKRSELFVRSVIIGTVPFLLDTLLKILLKSGNNFICENQLKLSNNRTTPDSLTFDEINKISYIICNFVCKAFSELAFEWITIKLFTDICNLSNDKDNDNMKRLFTVSGYVCHHIYNFFYTNPNINKNHVCNKDNILYHTSSRITNSSEWDLVKLGNFFMERLIECTFDDLSCRCTQIIVLRSMNQQITNHNSLIVSLVQKAVNYIHDQYSILDCRNLFEDNPALSTNLQYIYSVRLEKEIGNLFNDICKVHCFLMKEMLEALYPLLFNFCKSRYFHHSSTERILNSLIDLCSSIDSKKRLMYIMNLSGTLIELFETDTFVLFIQDFPIQFNQLIVNYSCSSNKISFDGNLFEKLICFVNLFNVVSHKFLKLDIIDEDPTMTSIIDKCYSLNYQLLNHCLLIWNISNIQKYPKDLANALHDEASNMIVPSSINNNVPQTIYSENILKIRSFMRYLIEKSCAIEKNRLFSYYYRRMIGSAEIIHSVHVVWSSVIELYPFRIYSFLKCFIRKFFEFIISEQLFSTELYDYYTKFCMDIYKIIKSQKTTPSEISANKHQIDQKTTSTDINNEILTDFLQNVFTKESLNIMNGCLFAKSNDNLAKSNSNSTGTIQRSEESNNLSSSSPEKNSNLPQQTGLFDYQNTLAFKLPTNNWTMICSLYFELCCLDDSITVRLLINQIDYISKTMVNRISSSIANDLMLEYQLVDHCYCMALKIIHIHNSDNNIISTFFTVFLRFYDLSKTNGLSFHIERLVQFCSIPIKNVEDFDKQLSDIQFNQQATVKHKKSRDFLKVLLSESIKKFNSSKIDFNSKTIDNITNSFYPIEDDINQQEMRKIKLKERNLVDDTLKENDSSSFTMADFLETKHF